MALLAALIVLFVLLGARLVELQTINPEEYVDLARAQTHRTQVLAADRGTIFDRNGVELAVSVPSQTIYADPGFIEDPTATARELAPILEVDEADLAATLAEDNNFEYLARQVPDELGESVEELDLPGIYLLEEPQRLTPSGDIAGALVGQTDIDNIGLGGLELQYDDILTGTPGRLTLEQDPVGRTIPVGQHDLVPAQKGDDVMLTIDRALQYEAERQLLSQVETLGARGGTVVVSDPRTGEILSMVNVDRDPETDEARLSANNMALTTVYEPGSVMKAVTWSKGFEEGKVSEDVCVGAPDSLTIADKTFTEYKPHGGGCFLPEQAIAASSNTASINVGRAIGPEALYDGFGDFGLGQPSGLDFPNEQTGVVRPVEDWWSTSLGSMSIGQGISVTPMQMLLVYNSIANGGLFVPPKIVRSTIDSGGTEHLTPVTDSRRAVGEETAAIMTRMLRGVVDNGTAKAAAISGYDSCGKTGTALKPYGNGYTGPDGATHYMGTFVGFLPCDDPQLSIIVVIDDPSGGAYTGGAVSAPVFAELSDYAVRHFEIPPARDEGTAGEPKLAPPAGSPPVPEDGEGPSTVAAATVPSRSPD